MAQFDPATFSPQLVWLVITFGVFYFALAKCALPRIIEVLEERQHNIDESLDKAAALKEEAKAAAEAYEKSLSEARAKAQAVMREAREEMAADATRRQQALADRLAADIQAAERRIIGAKEKAISHLNEAAAGAAFAVIEKLTGEKPSAKDLSLAVDSLMKART